MLQPEQILQNRYQLKQKLGENAARQTWLATDLEAFEVENSQVVVKLLAFGGQVQWENLKLFEREAQVLQQLNYPRIPKYRDYFCIDDRLLWFALVEEYIPGYSFKDLLIQGKKFTDERVRKIAVDILSILVYLHELNPPVLHRDIKPSNLILGEDEEVYLVDFGAVQDRAAKEGGTFTVVGTYGYTPIEQFGGRAVPASDLYALGATLIHLLTGTAPSDLPQRDLRIQFSDKVSVSSSLVNWLEQLIEPALERRFSTAIQALLALETSIADNQNSLQPTFCTPNAKISRPHNTRVELNKSPSRLEIKIKPVREIRGIEYVNLVFGLGYLVVVSIATFTADILFASFVMSVFLIQLLLFLQPYFCTTYIDINHDIFETIRTIFSIPYFHRQGLTSDIQDVSFSEPLGVTITFVSPYINRAIKRSFGRALTEAELIWLAQEIRDWLQQAR